jgi:hypothetical protein
VEASLRLSGWREARRVIVLRRRVTGHLLAEGRADESRGQASLLFANTPEQLPVWEYSVRVTHTEYSLEAIGQLYRDRADCENGIDELKNQWGWGGYTTCDLERCNLSAGAVALTQGRTMDRPRALHHRTIPRQQTQKSLLPRPPCSDNHGKYRVTEEFRITQATSRRTTPTQAIERLCRDVGVCKLTLIHAGSSIPPLVRGGMERQALARF